MSYGYPPPAHHQQWYGAPPAPPVDPYRAWYADQLAQLTFNSRPIIQHLSMQAMEQRDQRNMPGMQAIAEEIENAVLRAPPTGKLPLLYLIDSISKNVGAPYTSQLFPMFLPQLYLKTYREVDGVTKSKMEEMLKLWRSSGPGRGDLYPPAMREKVERDIFGSLGAPLTQPEVQATLREYLKEKEEEMALEFSPKLAKTVNILVQIDQVLSSSQVSPPELANIMEKIRGMKAGLDPNSIKQQQPIRSPLPYAQPPPPQQQRYPPPVPAPAYRAPAAYPPAPSYPQAPAYPPASFPASNFAPRGPPAVPTPPPPAAPLALPAIPLNVADILRNLSNVGALSQTATPEPTSSSRSGLNSYEDMILALDIRVDHFDLTKLSLPVAHIPERCQQCGMRFPDREGEKFRTHMDWHFQRNRKERETEGRGAHRRWLPKLDEWVNENAEAGPSEPKPEVKDTGLSAEKLAALRQKWVPTPSDPAKAAKPCPICKEQFKSEWSEDEEEWIFKNAIDVNGTIYHATCRAEKIASNVTARLLQGERKASPSPAPDELKRKAEDEGTDEDAKRVKVEPKEESGPNGADLPGPEETAEVKAEPVEAAQPTGDATNEVGQPAEATDQAVEAVATADETEVAAAPAEPADPSPAVVATDGAAQSDSAEETAEPEAPAAPVVTEGVEAQTTS